MVWFCSLLGIGTRLTAFLGSGVSVWIRGFFSLALGSLFYAGFAEVTSLFCTLPVLRILFAGLMCLGNFFFIEKVQNRKIFQSPPLGRWNTFLVAFLILSVFLRLLEGFSLHGHGDSLICYLTATRHFAQTGTFKIFQRNPIYFFSSSWENLFLYGESFFTTSPTIGLASSQRFAQWCTAFIAHAGIIGSAGLIGFFLFQNLTFSLLCSLAASTVPVLRWMQNLAKNDLGVLFWALSGILMLLAFDPKKNRHFLIAGLFLGSSIIGKFSNVSVLVFLSVWLFSQRTAFLHLFLFATGGILGSAAILIRNTIYAHDPFFPWMKEIFKSEALGPTLTANFLSGSSLSKFGFQFSFLIEFLGQQPWLCFILIAPLIALIKKDRRLLFFSLGALLQSTFFLFFFRSKTEIRYLNVGLVLSSISALASLVLLARDTKYFQKALIGISLLVLIPSNLSFFTLKQFWGPKYAHGTEGIEVHSNGVAKKWLRQNHPGAKTLVFGDNEPYYMLGETYIINDYDRFVDEALEKNESGTVLKTAQSLGFQYIFDFLPNPQGARRDQLRVELTKTQSPKVYQDATTVIYDITNTNVL